MVGPRNPAASLRALAGQLENLADRVEARVAVNARQVQSCGARADEALVELARTEFAQRARLRERDGEDLVGDPAWDLMLWVFIYRLELPALRTGTVFGACGFSRSVGLRVTERLVKGKLLLQVAGDEGDTLQLTALGRRRVLSRLIASIVNAMTALGGDRPGLLAPPG